MKLIRRINLPIHCSKMSTDRLLRAGARRSGPSSPGADFIAQYASRPDLLEHLTKASKSRVQIAGGHDTILFEFSKTADEVIIETEISPEIYEIECRLADKTNRFRKPSTIQKIIRIFRRELVGLPILQVSKNDLE